MISLFDNYEIGVLKQLENKHLSRNSDSICTRVLASYMKVWIQSSVVSRLSTWPPNKTNSKRMSFKIAVHSNSTSYPWDLNSISPPHLVCGSLSPEPTESLILRRFPASIFFSCDLGYNQRWGILPRLKPFLFVTLNLRACVQYCPGEGKKAGDGLLIGSE